MKNYENTFIRGISPSYSDEVTSENAISTSIPGLPLTEAEDVQPDNAFLTNGKYLSSGFLDVAGTTYSANFLSKGRRTIIFWTLIIFLLILTIGNLILTLIIITVLRLGKGIQGVELVPDDVIKFYGITDLDRVYSKTNGNIDGFANIPVTITGDSSKVFIKLQRNGQSHNRLIMDKNGIHFKAINTFEMRDPTSNAIVFTTHRPQYKMPAGADNLIAKSVGASRLSSPLWHPLTLNSDGRILVKGSEGISMDSVSLALKAERGITINSTHGATILEAGIGIFLEMDKIPTASSEHGLRSGSVQYKVCVCMPHGKLFRIAIPRNTHNGLKVSCIHFNADHDPCTIK